MQAALGSGEQEIIVCVTGSVRTRAEERQEMKSRGQGPQHAGLTGHGEQLQRAMGSHGRF